MIYAWTRNDTGEVVRHGGRDPGRAPAGHTRHELDLSVEDERAAHAFINDTGPEYTGVVAGNFAPLPQAGRDAGNERRAGERRSALVGAIRLPPFRTIADLPETTVAGLAVFVANGPGDVPAVAISTGSGWAFFSSDGAT